MMRFSAAILLLFAPDDKEAEDAIQKFKAGMKSPEVAARVQAVTDLGRTQHEKTLKVLAVCLATDDKSVRIAAAKALGGFLERKPKAVALLADALGANAREPDVEVAILAALQALHDRAALGTAYRFLEDKNGRVAEAAVLVTGAIHSRDSIDPLIKLLKRLVGAGDGVTGAGAGGYDVPPDEVLKERARLLEPAANKALAAITGERLSGAKEWETWWKKNAGTFVVKD
jgi:HEAT repeat protein